MEQVTLNIPDTKISSFIAMIKRLDLTIENRKRISLEDELSPAQKKTWKNIKQGFEEMKLVEAGIKKARPIQELLDEL
jgi:hypothetical protein